MKYISALLIFLGAALTLVALNLDVTVDDSEVTNLNLMAQRQNLLIIGCVIFIAGIIVCVSSIKSSTVHKEESAAMDKLGKLNLTALWHKYDSCAKMFVLSSLAIFVAACIPWEIFGVRSGGQFMSVGSHYLGLAQTVVVFMLWAYPVYTLIIPKNRLFKILTINTIAAALWMGWSIFKFWAWSLEMEKETGVEINAGKGIFLASTAVLFLIVGTFLARSPQVVKSPPVSAS